MNIWKKATAVMLSVSMAAGTMAAPLAAAETGTAVSNGTTNQSQQPPELPEGMNGEMPEGMQKPDGEMPSGMQKPENMSGEMPTSMELPEGMEGQEPPAKPDGENGEMPEGMQKPDGQMPNGEMPGGMEKPDGEMPGGQAPGDAPGGQQSQVEGQLGSWSMGGTDASTVDGDDYAYDAALYITEEGVDEEKSAADRISSGTYDETSASDLVIDDSESGHNGILVNNAEYEITNAEITLITDADGSDTCDFSGKGSAVAVFGEDGKVTISNSTIHTAGVATMPIFADAGATVTIDSSTLISEGGTLHSEYLNTPSQTLMVAPPWILGIMGTSRTSNMMGNDTTTNVIDSETSAGAWAVLSTDAGSDMYLNVYNTSLTTTNADESQYLLQEEGGQITETLDNPYTENYGSGYGTYAIGNAVETFAGATINVGTYATIFTGGSGTYTSLEAGKTYELLNSAGEVTATYEAQEDKATVINSDTFGFMAHQDSNRIVLEKGATVNSGYATFLVKSGSSNETLTAEIDDSTMNNGGVLIQVMDNDDATNGGMMAVDDEANTNGGSQNFIPYHEEEAGFFQGEAAADNSQQNFTFTNGEYNGNIYNASGSDGLNGTSLNVALGSGAVLNGGAASTSAVHVTYEGSLQIKENGGAAFANAEEAAAFAEEYQNTYFSINEYFSMGHVANMIYDNGANAVNMILIEDAVWNVTDTSVISSLTIEGDAQVVVPADVTLTVNGTEYTDCVITADTL